MRTLPIDTHYPTWGLITLESDTRTAVGWHLGFDFNSRTNAISLSSTSNSQRNFSVIVKFTNFTVKQTSKKFSFQFVGEFCKKLKFLQVHKIVEWRRASDGDIACVGSKLRTAVVKDNSHPKLTTWKVIMRRAQRARTNKKPVWLVLKSGAIFKSSAKKKGSKRAEMKNDPRWHRPENEKSFKSRVSLWISELQINKQLASEMIEQSASTVEKWSVSRRGLWWQIASNQRAINFD